MQTTVIHAAIFRIGMVQPVTKLHCATPPRSHLHGVCLHEASGWHLRRHVHEASVNVVMLAPPVLPVFQVPDLEVDDYCTAATVVSVLTDVVYHVVVNAAPWLWGTKYDVAHFQCA